MHSQASTSPQLVRDEIVTNEAGNRVRTDDLLIGRSSPIRVAKGLASDYHTGYGNLESRRFTAVNFELSNRRNSLSARDAGGHQRLEFCSETRFNAVA